MIQLTFQPALDPLHAAFRFLRLRNTFKKHRPLHRDHARILDFFLLFPFRISSIRLKPQHRRYRKLASQYEIKKPYGEQPENQILFGRMASMQDAGLNTLAQHGLIIAERWRVAEVVSSDVSLASDLQSRIEMRNAQDRELIEFLELLGSDYELLGHDGLKGRTGLIEYRHDAI
jgi:hypothetical protein